MIFLLGFDSFHKNSRLLADWPGVSRERVVVGEPSVDSDRWHSKEPGKESQFLPVVGETVGHGDGWSKGPAQRIAYFKIALATGLLANVAPRRHQIVAERIVLPFRDLVRHDGDVGHGTQENAAGIVVRRRKGLRAVHAAVEAENAARAAGRESGTVGSFAFDRVVNQEDRKG